MPVTRLPSKPNLDHLKHQVRDLLEARSNLDRRAAQQIREFHAQFLSSSDAEIFSAKFQLSDAQLVIARAYGFPSWSALKLHVENPAPSDQLDLPHHERIEDPVFRRAVELLDAGDPSGLRGLLKQHPKLTRQHVVFQGGNYFTNPTLLEFIAENPVRHGRLPRNIIEVAQVILDAGVEQSSLDRTLELLSTGGVPRECRVQVPLIDLLCDRGADPGRATQAAATHGEFEAVNALTQRGASITLPVATALGHLDDFSRLLPTASSQDRHLSLAMACQFGHLDIVKLLIDAGEDPNRYNPIGSHSHSTPLHEAAWEGHDQIVRLLVQRGAKVDLRDVLWQGTPADWAAHGGRTEIEAYLRSRQALR